MGLFESDVSRCARAGDMLYTMCDGPNLLGVAWTMGLIQIMGLLSGRRVHASFIGSSQIDKLSNTNTSQIGPPVNPEVKLPYSGGAAYSHYEPSKAPAGRKGRLYHLTRPPDRG